MRGSGSPPAMAAGHWQLSAQAAPLDPSTRSFMQTRFERDFSHVRIHADAVAAASARQLDALAYTAGNDIVFGAGQYAPSSAAGRRLLAHELTHVVQQRRLAPRVQRQPVPQSSTRAHQAMDHREFVESATTFLRGSADFYGDPSVKLDQARFERVINEWYAMVTEREATLDTELGGDAKLEQALHDAYLAAIRALLPRAAAAFHKTEDELYRVNSGRMPMWAWQVAHPQRYCLRHCS